MAVILIVDDSPTELHLFQNMLEKSGFDVLVADSGEEGIRQAKMLNPDCILMDVVMPGMNGFQATRKITQDPGTRNIPVMINLFFFGISLFVQRRYNPTGQIRRTRT